MLGNGRLQVIAAELVKTIREKSTVDWWRRDNVRAAMRVVATSAVCFESTASPPDLQDEAVKLIIQQAEALAQAMPRAA